MNNQGEPTKPAAARATEPPPVTGLSFAFPLAFPQRGVDDIAEAPGRTPPPPSANDQRRAG